MANGTFFGDLSYYSRPWYRFVQIDDTIDQEPVSRSPCALLKLDFLTNAMHLLYALVS